jgi:hypothetical protein
MEAAISSKLVRKEKRIRGERQGMVDKGANKTMNGVGISYKVLDYWRQLKQEYIQEKRLARCGPRTSWTDLDSSNYQAIAHWRWMDAPTILSSKP